MLSPVVERFLRYVSFDTQSDETSSTVPSTPGQLVLARALADELRAMGVEDVTCTENGYVYASIPSNVDHPVPAVGLLAHMDTAAEMPGKDVKPRILHYEGGAIVLNEEKGIVMDHTVFDRLERYIGCDLIVTDGTTLLGSDDKAGVAEIMTYVADIMADPTIPHGPVKIGFTPDEEIGRGPDLFDVPLFGADFAFTLDGGAPGDVNYENFNACTAVVKVTGTPVHPGSAKGKMKNAATMLMEFNGMLPAFEKPEFTEGYEGFAHLVHMQGDVASASGQYIIRDHDRTLFEQRKARFEAIAAYLNGVYGEGAFEVTLTDSYYNMREVVEPHKYILDVVCDILAENGFAMNVEPIRGGTDGCRLSFMGLPCPNLYAGGEYAHGQYEFVAVQNLETIVKLVHAMMARYAEAK